MSDRPTHPARLFTYGSAAGLEVTCPHDPADETRPCWPHTDGVPDPAPQTVCTIVDWVEAVDMACVSEIDLVGSVTWERCGDDGPTIHFQPAPRSLPPEWERLQALRDEMEVEAAEWRKTAERFPDSAATSRAAASTLEWVLARMDAITVEAQQ